MSRRRRLGVLAVVVVALALGAAAAWPALRDWSAGDDVPVATVTEREFVRRVTAEGNLEAAKATPITAPIEMDGGAKIAWLAPDGTRVRAGEVIVRFDPSDMQKSLEDGVADLDAAGNRIDGKHAEERGMLRNLDRDAALAGLELEYARAFQSKDAEIFSRMQIIESQIDEDLSSRRKDHAKAVRGIRQKQIGAEIELLEIDRRKADLKVAKAEKGLRALEVVAPHDGIVVFQRGWRGEPKRVGEDVWPGEPIAEIPDLGGMDAEIFVLEADAGGLQVGQAASVIVESVPDRSWPAKIKSIAPLAKPRSQWQPVQYFSVTLSLDRTEPSVMKPGQRVRADLALDKRGTALVVPRDAVVEKDGKRIVYRRRESDWEPVEVTLGPSAPGRVVVEKGLAAGDVVALRDPTLTPEELEAKKKAETSGSSPRRRGGGGGRRGGGMRQVIIR